MKIGDLTIPEGAALAPMAGVADSAFRSLCASFGAVFTVSEMVSAKGLVMGDGKSARLMRFDDRTCPAGIQLFGADPSYIAEAVPVVMTEKPDFIDLNMGCPAPKVTKNGSGSALMRDPAKIERIVAAAAKVSPVPVTVKMRLGWDEQSRNAVECALAAEAGGAACITVHGRTRTQMYAPPVDRSGIAAVKKAVAVPVIGNGDIVNGLDALSMKRETGCDLVMIGRAAMGRPWVFRDVLHALETGESLPEPPAAQRMQVMLDHVAAIIADKGERIGIREARKHALCYARGIRGAAGFRRELSLLESLDCLREIADRIIEAANETRGEDAG